MTWVVWTARWFSASPQLYAPEPVSWLSIQLSLFLLCHLWNRNKVTFLVSERMVNKRTFQHFLHGNSVWCIIAGIYWPHWYVPGLVLSTCVPAVWGGWYCYAHLMEEETQTLWDRKLLAQSMQNQGKTELGLESRSFWLLDCMPHSGSPWKVYSFMQAN